MTSELNSYARSDVSHALPHSSGPMTPANHMPSMADETIRARKRSLDIACVVITLPFTLLLMGLVVIWIKLISRGPVLLRQKRIGRHGEPFVLYKFRSMKVNSATDRHEAHVRNLVKLGRPMIKLDHLCDARLIAGGCLLRASGLDELPQLLNVLRGDMSLVGPRPCLPCEYGNFTQPQRERFNALPGITGLWQVNGKHGCTFIEMNALDIHYVRNATLLTDLHIMLRTPAALVFQMCLAFQHKRTIRRFVAFEEFDAMTVHGNVPRTHHPLS